MGLSLVAFSNLLNRLSYHCMMLRECENPSSSWVFKPGIDTYP